MIECVNYETDVVSHFFTGSMGKTMGKKRTCRLTSVGDNEKLVELVRSNPFIYDATSPYHKDTIMLANTWKSIAAELNIPGLSGTCRTLNYL